jgi:hypothetical protein
MTEAKDIELLYDVWEQNIETLRALHRYSNEEPGIVPQLVAHLRSCAIGLVKLAGIPQALEESKVAKSSDPVTQRIINKSALAISEPKRIRCKEHLRYVASQPCVICGRSPSHAHHLRYAQRRGLGIKVSDEFTVPLCATHHHQLHNTTKEREWWQERKIDPLMSPVRYGARVRGVLLIQLKPPTKDGLSVRHHRQDRTRRDCTRDPN